VGVLLLAGAALMPEPLTGRPAWIDDVFDMAVSYKFDAPDWRTTVLSRMH
jgi:hypothetical protein